MGRWDPAPGAVVLLSGGQDSTTCLYYALREWGRPLHALFIEYGQRHWIENTSARRVASGIKVDAYHGDVMGAKGMGLYSQLTKRSGEPITQANMVVEGRNAMFLTIAAAYAKNHGLGRVVIGCGKDDYADFPDCRPQFLSKLNDALRLGLDYRFRIEAPLVQRTKKETVHLARELGAECWDALAQTWTCYDPAKIGIRCHEVAACGQCPACKLRARGFAEAGESDPGNRDLAPLHVGSGSLAAERAAGAQVQGAARPHISGGGEAASGDVADEDGLGDGLRRG